MVFQSSSLGMEGREGIDVLGKISAPKDGEMAKSAAAERNLRRSNWGGSNVGRTKVIRGLDFLYFPKESQLHSKI